MLNAIILAVTAIAVAGLAGLSYVILKHIEQMETQMNADASTATAQKVVTERQIMKLDADLATESRTTDEEIQSIVKLLDDIVKDITRLNETTTRDHRDLVDIRSRYINFREPISQEAQPDGND